MARETGFLKLQIGLKEKFGADAVVLAKDIPKFGVVSSGSLSADYISGIGGLPDDRVIEFAGQEGAGKTTLALLTIKSFLEREEEKALADTSYRARGAIIIDMEHRITSDWLTDLVGAKWVDRIIIAWPDNAEESTDVFIMAVQSKEICIVVYDSIGGSPSQRVTGKSATSGNIGGNALPMTRLAQFATINCHKYKCLGLFINQLRDDMGGYNRMVTPGGRALKHAFSLRYQVKKGKQKVWQKINGENIQVGYSVVVKVVKNSVGAPGRLGWYLFYNVPCKHGFGVDTLEELIRLSTLTGVVRKSGAYYYHESFPGGKIKSVARLVALVKENEEVQKILVTETKESLKGTVEGVSGTFDVDADDDDDGEEPELAPLDLDDLGDDEDE